MIAEESGNRDHVLFTQENQFDPSESRKMDYRTRPIASHVCCGKKRPLTYHSEKALKHLMLNIVEFFSSRHAVNFTKSLKWRLVHAQPAELSIE